MKVRSQEHYDLMMSFERIAKKKHRYRMERESKADWPKGIIYQSPELNELFLSFREGYALAKGMALRGEFESSTND